MIERLIAQDDSREIAAVLAEAYFTSGAEIHQDWDLRRRVVERLARASATHPLVLNRFPDEEVAPIANSALGTIRSGLALGEAFFWLQGSPKHIDRVYLRERILHRTTESPIQLCELINLSFMCLDFETLARLADDAGLLSSRGPSFNSSGVARSSQAITAVFALKARLRMQHAEGIDRILQPVLDKFLYGRPTAREVFDVGLSLTPPSAEEKSVTFSKASPRLFRRFPSRRRDFVT